MFLKTRLNDDLLCVRARGVREVPPERGVPSTLQYVYSKLVFVERDGTCRATREGSRMSWVVLDNKILFLAFRVFVVYVLCPALGGRPAGQEGGSHERATVFVFAGSKEIGCTAFFLQFLPAQSKARNQENQGGAQTEEGGASNHRAIKSSTFRFQNNESKSQ